MSSDDKGQQFVDLTDKQTGSLKIAPVRLRSFELTKTAVGVDGRLTALDKTTGRKLWEFQTDGGVNAPASVFERNGKGYVVVLAGGTALGGSKRSDGLWLFSLAGTVNSLPRGAADPAAAPRPALPAAGAATPGTAQVPDLARGKDLYTTTCVVCHGPTGLGGTHGGAKLTRALTAEAITVVLTRGRNDMPAFGSALAADQLQDLTGYVLQVAAQNPPP